jgi:symplekin
MTVNEYGAKESCRDTRDSQRVVRINQYLERLMQSRAEMLDAGRRKRPLAEAEVVDAKRQRVNSGQPDFEIPPLKAGPHSLADIFTLTPNEGLRAFDANLVPLELAAKISITTIIKVDDALLNMAINVSAPSDA